mgnify:CR=1 FL=1
MFVSDKAFAPTNLRRERTRALRLGLVVLAMFAVATGGSCGGDDDDDAPEEGDPRYGCVYESSLIDSCNNPMGSPWTEGCVDVLIDDDCTLATAEMVEEVGECTFTTTYRNVTTTPGQPCPDEEMPIPTQAEAAAAGEPCADLDDCASGLCVPRFYCTVSCSEDSQCAEDFPGGCCVGEGSLGYCLSQDDCAGLCPPDSTPVGLPTVCVCNDGFAYDPPSGQCVAS